jgi:hypothetical protein
MRWTIYFLSWLIWAILGVSLLSMSEDIFIQFLPSALGILIITLPFLMRVYFWVQEKRASIPAMFSGWCYGLCALCCTILIVATGFSVGVMTSAEYKLGNVSSVPFQLAVIFSALSWGVVFISTEISEIYGRIRNQP